MKKQLNIIVSIPRPCKIAWNDMQHAGSNRHCNECNKLIIDFSLFSDEQLLQYFKTNGMSECGRFHTSQLNKPIIPLKKKNVFFNKFKSGMAACITFLSLKGIANNENKNEVSYSVQPNIKKQTAPLQLGDTIIITGTIKDIDQRPMEGVVVKFGDYLSVLTDINGKFEFKFDKSLAKDHTPIYVKQSGSLATTRSWYPTLGSTTYEITLGTRFENDYSSYVWGGLTLTNPDDYNFKIDFLKFQKILTTDMKVKLAVYAGNLRNNPGVSITIHAYVKSEQETQLANARLKIIKAYLTNSEGIGYDRFKTKTNTVSPLSTTNRNSIELKLTED